MHEQRCYQGPVYTVALGGIWLHRCKTLDASADGYVRAEAVGCAILVPAAAVPEGMLPGLVLLSGSAVNQDGRSSSLTAPNGPSQQGVIRQALQAGGVLGAEVAMVQMHGTGTPLGGKPLPPTLPPPPSPPPLPSPPTFTRSDLSPIEDCVFTVLHHHVMCDRSGVFTGFNAVQLTTSWIGPDKACILS